MRKGTSPQSMDQSFGRPAYALYAQNKLLLPKRAFTPQNALYAQNALLRPNFVELSKFLQNQEPEPAIATKMSIHFIPYDHIIQIILAVISK
jgi:hypothetical protein